MALSGEGAHGGGAVFGTAASVITDFYGDHVTGVGHIQRGGADLKYGVAVLDAESEAPAPTQDDRVPRSVRAAGLGGRALSNAPPTDALVIAPADGPPGGAIVTHEVGGSRG